MKKQLLTLLCAALLLSACGQKDKTQQGQNPVQNQTETAKANDYSHLNPGQDATPAVIEEDLSGKVIALTSSEFSERVAAIDPELGLRYKGKTPCMVDFYADWCRPCMQLKPITEKLAAKYKGQIIIYKINVDKAQDICQSLGIQNIPTLIFLKPNAQPGKMVGAPSEAELEKVIKEFVQ